MYILYRNFSKSLSNNNRRTFWQFWASEPLTPNINQHEKLDRTDLQTFQTDSHPPKKFIKNIPGICIFKLFNISFNIHKCELQMLILEKKDFPKKMIWHDLFQGFNLFILIISWLFFSFNWLKCIPLSQQSQNNQKNNIIYGL